MAEGEHSPAKRGRTGGLAIPGIDQVEVVGSGGFAVVYRGRQKALNRTVAVKVLSIVELDDHAVRRFERERSVLGSLSDHPNIVTIFESGLTGDGIPYLVMEYLPLGSFADRIAEDGPVPWERVLPIGVKLAGALETAHKVGVLHRDVKPENVLLSSFGEPKLADFGIARVIEGPTTHSGRMEMSVLHAPPEIIDGQPPSVAADVYSLGSTLFALLFGRPAFLNEDDESLVRLLNRIAVEDPPNLRWVGVPEELAVVVERTLSKSPADRHVSPLELGRQLQEIEAANDLPVTTLPMEGLDAPPPRRSRARRAPTAEPPAVTEVEPDPVQYAPPPRVTVPMPPTIEVGAQVRSAAGGSSGSRRGLGVAAIAAAVAVAIVLAIVVWPSGGRSSQTGGGKIPPTKPQPTTTVAQVTIAPPPPVGALRATAGPLAAGRYRSTRFSPAITLTVPDGWRVRSDESSSSLELGPVTSEKEAVSFFRLQSAVDENAQPSGGRAATAAAQPLPADVPAWLAQHPKLTAATPVATTRGNVSGKVLEVSAKDGYDEFACRPLTCVVLFLIPDGLVATETGDLNRFFVWSAPSGQYLAAITAPQQDFASFQRTAESVLGSMSVATP